MLGYRKHRIIAFLVALPSIVAIAIFVYGFIFWTVKVSTSNWNSFSRLVSGKYKFVGLRNYVRVFRSYRFKKDLYNTLFFTILFLFGATSLGLLLAVLVDKGLKGSSIFQNIFLFPMAVSFVVTGTVWRWIFDPGTLPLDPHGINLLLEKVGLKKLMWGWYTSTASVGPFNVALIPVAIAAIWQFAGYTMALYLAGLRAIPQEIEEAAKVDGASDTQIFWKVKFPLLKPITLTALIVLGHISLKIFDLVYAMTGSGPNFVTDFPAMYMFELTFRSNRYAMGSAIAIVMLLMVSAVIVPYLISMRGREER